MVYIDINTMVRCATANLIREVQQRQQKKERDGSSRDY